MPPDRRQYLRVLRTYLTVRKWRWLLAMMILIGVVVASWGSFVAPTPSAADNDGASVQFWRLLAVGSGSLPVLTLVSPMKALEAAAGPAYYRVQAVVLAGAFVVSSAVILAAAATGVGPAVTPLLARALLAWFGLALLSGRVLGWHNSWVFPWAAMSGLLYWGHSSVHGYHWWEFTAQPATHLPSVVLAGGLCAAGVAAYTLSPWRMRRLLRFRGTTGEAGRPPQPPPGRTRTPGAGDRADTLTG